MICGFGLFRSDFPFKSIQISSGSNVMSKLSPADSSFIVSVAKMGQSSAG